ncbi:MAG: peptidase M14 [Bacteroidetes bacterium]|nr:peptidase M14 [Bacteroidota bacterium]MCW5896915.1 peptidase M14 [Bacteroidota bacterium]
MELRIVNFGFRIGLLVAGICILMSGEAFAQSAGTDAWETYFEKSGGKRTPPYAETIEYCKRLASASPWVKYTSFGKSPQGRELPLVVLSKGKIFDPAKARASGKAIILIQSGIHSGEIDGKDASLMLMRDIAITKKYGSLLDNTILLFVPIFSVDAHERSGPYNRINQNGPEEMGWRVNAQNLNLNRDYLKADTPEMRAMLRLFSAWLPDLYVDCHVTDGIDCQYDITYAIETAQNIDPSVAQWINQKLLPESLPKVEAAGHKIFYYVFPREDNDLSKGLTAGAAPPRFSTGYGALHNRPTMLIETHMLKPYKVRVEATYHFLKAMIECVNADAKALRHVVQEADRAVINAGSNAATMLPLTFGLSEKSEMRKFLGIKSRMEPSPVSGGMRRVYTGEAEEIVVPFFSDVTVTDSVRVPYAYLIPAEWKFVDEILTLHGVNVKRITHPTAVEVESYRFSDVKFRERPYEGRQGATFKTETIKEARSYPQGTLIVRTNQRTAKVAMHLLEPRGPDSFVAWGFFNTIFEQKEYAESYVMEEVAATMLAEDSALKQEFEHKVQSDTSFARNPRARLNWLYLRSKWVDPWLHKYPVGRVVDETEFLKLK